MTERYKSEQGTCFHFETFFDGKIIIANENGSIEIPAEECYLKPKQVSDLIHTPWRAFIGDMEEMIE